MGSLNSGPEWAAHNIRITVDYEILRQYERYLSFAVRGYENWSSACNESRYYNLDLTTGAEVTLRDLLGENYEALANESIRAQIAEREQAREVFFAPEAGGLFRHFGKHPILYQCQSQSGDCV